MAFTNPILSGEELNRTGIRSENYVPGESGWRVANDGAAEFDNIGIRGNIWAPSITLNGQDLTTRLNNAPKGLTAFITGTPVVATTTEQRFMLVDFDIVAGRYYEVFVTNITADRGNVGAIEYHLRWTFGTNPAIPTTSSDLVCNSLRHSQFQLPVIRFTFWSGATARARVAAFITSLDGVEVRTWAPGAGCTLGVIDHGIAPYAHPGQGTVGSGIIPKVLKEWTITANNSYTYHGDGVRRIDARINDLVAGDWENGRGNQRAWWTFSAADALKLDELIGVPLVDVEIAEVYLWNLQWRSLTDDGYVTLGFHNQNDLFLYAGEPPGGVPNVYRPFVSGGGGWLSIKPGGPVPTDFLTSMREGYLNGFMVGNSTFGQQYCGVFDGYDSGPAAPKLHMRYWK
jgi:hypothetical protein